MIFCVPSSFVVCFFQLAYFIAISCACIFEVVLTFVVYIIIRFDLIAACVLNNVRWNRR